MRGHIRALIHVLALWVAHNLYDAFDAAKRRSQARLQEFTASRIPLPWGPYYADQAQQVFGADPWPYGVAPNRTTLDAFLGWAHEQGVAHRAMQPAELFAPETATTVRV